MSPSIRAKQLEKGIGDYIKTTFPMTNKPSKGSIREKLYISVRMPLHVAPFDRCDREQDYETAWKFFEEKYGKEES